MKAQIEAGPLKFVFEGDDEAVTRKMEMVQPLIQAWIDKGHSESLPAAPGRKSNPEEILGSKPDDKDGSKIQIDPTLKRFRSYQPGHPLHPRDESRSF